MSEKKEFYITEEGLKQLKIDLEQLKMVKRPQVIEALKEARALGDLSENAEYEAARTEQAEVEGKILELEKLLEEAKIITKVSTDSVSIGNKVEVEFVEDKEKDEYFIVGSKESDPFANKISNESPIAQALLNHKKGEKVTVDSPNGKFDLKILNIQ